MNVAARLKTSLPLSTLLFCLLKFPCGGFCNRRFAIRLPAFGWHFASTSQSPRESPGRLRVFLRIRIGRKQANDQQKIDLLVSKQANDFCNHRFGGSAVLRPTSLLALGWRRPSLSDAPRLKYTPCAGGRVVSCLEQQGNSYFTCP